MPPPVNIVARYKDGTVLKGQTSDFFPNSPLMHLHAFDGSVHLVRLKDLKAVFFVKNHAGDHCRIDEYTDEICGVGRKMRVKLKDGEVMVGYTAGYSKLRPGFFLVPADADNNNERVFILNDFCEATNFV